MKIAVAIFVLAFALYLGLDPLNHSAIHDFPDFEAVRIEMDPWSQIPNQRDLENRLQRSDIVLLGSIQGPESVAFDPSGRGPYTGIADGRIMFWNGTCWTHFASTSPNRSELCDLKPSPLSYLKNEHICGRPLGLRFEKKTGDLYIADAYFGVMKVGPEGGVARSLVSEVQGEPLRFTNDLDIDIEGNVYFTDSSTKFQRRNFLQLIFSSEDSGRVLKYDPITRKTSVVLSNVQFPNGLSLSKDSSFLVLCECSVGRLRKIWLNGKKAGSSELFATVPGAPDNVRLNEKGEFWVGIHARRSNYGYIMGLYPKLRMFILRLPIPAKYHYLLQIGGRPHGVVAKYSQEGEFLQILEDSRGKVVKSVSEVEEKDGRLWIGSVLMPFLAVYDLE